MRQAVESLIAFLVLTAGTLAWITGCGGTCPSSNTETGGAAAIGGKSGGLSGGSGGGQARCAKNDVDCDELPDDLGEPVYDPSTGKWVDGDFNGDYIADGKAIDENGDSLIDGVGLDTDQDGYIDSIDRDGDGQPDKTTGLGERAGSGGSA